MEVLVPSRNELIPSLAEPQSLHDEQSTKPVEVANSDDNDEEEEFGSIIASINISHLQELVISTRRKFFYDLDPHISCVTSTPPHTGAFNIVYVVSFSDGVKWTIRLPARGNVFSPTRARALHLDIIAHRFISHKTSIPIPRIHHWSLDADNVLSRPFVIMDFIPGVNLSSVWNDRNWITDVKRERIFEQIAGWMVELAAFEFDRIGCLDVEPASGSYHIVPFPNVLDIIKEIPGYETYDDATPAIPAGPFDTSTAFLSFLLSSRRRKSDNPTLASLHLFLSTLPDHTLDGPPFVFSHPDFDSQNVLVDDDGVITGIIDWDGVYIGPRQGGAAAYPSWITVDWDPMFYGWSADAPPEDNVDYDSPADLAKYRKAYLDAIQRASADKLTHITRNSHVWTTLYIGLVNELATSEIVGQLCRFMFGTGILHEIEAGIKRGSWYALRNSSGAIFEVMGAYFSSILLL